MVIVEVVYSDVALGSVVVASVSDGEAGVVSAGELSVVDSV